MANTTYTHNYTYLITNTVNGIKYIGVHSCNGIPEDDIKYMGSSKYLNAAMKEFGKENFTKVILTDHPTREEAVEDEIFLHELYDIAKNPDYYNGCKQSSIGFDTTGMKTVKNDLGESFMVPVTDNRYHGVTKNSTFNHKDNSNYSPAAIKRWSDEEFRTKNSKVISDRNKSPENRAKVSKALTGRKHTPQHNLNLSGSRHPMFKGYFITPWGKFTSASVALKHAPLDNLYPANTIIRYCKNDFIITSAMVNRSKYLTPNHTGLSTTQLGFLFEPAIRVSIVT